MMGAVREDRPIRVLVVDDHDLFRAGLASLLAMQPDIEVVAQASGGRMGIRLADELRPDVVIMDLRMPDVEGPAATRAILERNQDMRVLVLTVATDDSDVEAALEAGACGFIAKDTPVGGVAVAVRAAAQGVAWLSPRAAELVLGRVRQGASEPAFDVGAEEQLSARELDVLQVDRARDGERRDRRDARHQPTYGEEPRLEHPGQARDAEPCPGGDLRGPPWARLTRFAFGRQAALVTGEHEAECEASLTLRLRLTELVDRVPEMR